VINCSCREKPGELTTPKLPADPNELSTLATSCPGASLSCPLASLPTALTENHYALSHIFSDDAYASVLRCVPKDVPGRPIWACGTVTSVVSRCRSVFVFLEQIDARAVRGERSSVTPTGSVANNSGAHVEGKVKAVSGASGRDPYRLVVQKKCEPDLLLLTVLDVLVLDVLFLRLPAFFYISRSGCASLSLHQFTEKRINEKRHLPASRNYRHLSTVTFIV
ncbi:hypothetical protein BaRGS_00031223, partial [Batillaria attramentaria]